MADKHAFLSDSWFDAVDKLLAEHSPEGPPAADLVMNLEVGEGDDQVKFHMGSKGGETLFGRGHTDSADLTLSTDMDTARSVFVSGDQAAGMQAFMAGKVRVQGDMTKLMMSQGQGGDNALQEALQSITE